MLQSITENVITAVVRHTIFSISFHSSYVHFHAGCTAIFLINFRFHVRTYRTNRGMEKVHE